VGREEYEKLELDSKVEMIRAFVPLGLMDVHELLDDEVKELAGERYSRKEESVHGRRHGSNPGTVGLAGQRVPDEGRARRNARLPGPPSPVVRAGGRTSSVPSCSSKAESIGAIFL